MTLTLPHCNNYIQQNKSTTFWEVTCYSFLQFIFHTSNNIFFRLSIWKNPVLGGKAVYIARAMLRKRIIDSGSSLYKKAKTDLRAIVDYVVYPNPTTGFVFIKAPNASILMNEIKVFDITGRLLINNAVRNSIFYALDLSSLKAGSYCIKIENSIGSTCVKQIVLSK